MSTRVAVLGTGANGASIGADLVRAGHDVTFVEQWPEHVRAMRRDGLRVEMPDRTEVTQAKVLHLSEVATLRQKFDVVFMLVKAYDSGWACELIKPHVQDAGAVVALQNGMTLRTVERVMGTDRAIGGVLEVSSAMFTPGVVERHTPPESSWFTLGGLSAVAADKAERASELLKAAGTVELSNDIESSKWMKLVVNATELVTAAIVDLPMVEAARMPGMRDVMVAAGREAIKTGLAMGYRTVPILGLTEADTEDPDRFVEMMIDAVYNHFTLPNTMTTVHQDWIKGRHCEVDEINGLVVSAQAALGGMSPMNLRVVELAHAIEAGDLKAGRWNLNALVEASR